MAINNQLAARNGQPRTFSQYIATDAAKRLIGNAITDQRAAQAFTANIVSAVAANPALQECDFGTTVSAGLLANSLNLSLSPSLGFAYIVPFKDNKNNRTVSTFILGYRGYIQLAIRSGYYKRINAIEIREGELIKKDVLNEEYVISLIDDDDVREKTPVIGYLATFEHVNGFRKTIYWSKKKMLQHADRYSKAFSLNATGGKYPKVSYADFEAGKVPENEMWRYSSYWYQDNIGMSLKTMIRQLISKWGIMSIDMQRAYDDDSRGMNEHENIDFDTPEPTNDANDDFFNDVSDEAPTEAAPAPAEPTAPKRGRRPAAKAPDIDMVVDDDFGTTTDIFDAPAQL